MTLRKYLDVIGLVICCGHRPTLGR